jgi:hypothetical protein
MFKKQCLKSNVKQLKNSGSENFLSHFTQLQNHHFDWLIDLFMVLRSAQEFFIYTETLPLPVKGCKI